MTEPLADELCSLGMPVHLVVDGARAVNLGGPNIEQRLASHRLVGRSLFRETTDHAGKLAGPWLVSLGTDHPTLVQGAGAARELGKGVFWLGEPDAEAVFRHLRRLGAARMPDDRILYFRYYDPDVLAAIVPIVNAEQAAHLFGSSRVLLLVGGSGDGCNVERPDDLPGPPSGPIAFEQWQIEKLDERQRNLSRQKIARLLRKEYPEQMKQYDKADLEMKIAGFERSATDLNLTTEEAQWQWMRLNFETRERASQNLTLRRMLREVEPARANDTFFAIVPDLIASYHKTRDGIK